MQGKVYVGGKNEKTGFEGRGEERNETVNNVKKFYYRKHFVVIKDCNRVRKV
jgi:hypothetical protein